MSDAETILSQLPEPRGDEPRHLRVDIADELADHLHTATQSETAAHIDPEAARRRVLHRFGSPTRVALRLYLFHLKDHAIKTRIALASAAVLTLAALAGMTVLVLSQRAALEQLVAQAKHAPPPPSDDRP